MTTLAASTTTLANLEAAFNGETNAAARYAEFAKKADSEGFGGVASLFRATSRAEEFHARNHAEVIRAMGGEPSSTVENISVQATAANLKAAMEGEIYERDVMYPKFIEHARQNKEADAIRTFNYALKTEAEHARLFSDALKNMEKMRSAKTWYVCQVCGYTVALLNFVKCLVCAHSKNDYLAVN